MAATSPPAHERGWSSLPDDLLRDILARLPWSSHPSFAVTCKNWSTIVSPFYPAWITPLLLNAIDVGSTNLRYYSPYYHKIFEVTETLKTPNAKICCVNGDYLILYCCDDRYIVVVHANLATGFVQELKPLLVRHTFDFVVDDGEHNIFGIRAGEGTLRVARNILRNDDSFPDWDFSESTAEDPEFSTSSMTNPVFHHGLLYMLGEDGRLAVYDKRRHEQGFKILDKPVDLGEHMEDYFEYDDFYLFESDEGQLMAVLADRRGSPLYVVKLNEDSMEWEEVQSLEGRALFTGTLRTIMVNTDVKWMRNRIFFPRLHQWPGILHCNLVNREGELAFVPKSAMASQDGGADGNNIWTCGLGKDKSAEFWGSENFNYSIWVKFDKLTR